VNPPLPTFAPFGLVHAAWLIAIFGAAWLWVRWARREPDALRRRHVEQMVAYANLMLWIVIRLYLLTPISSGGRSGFRWGCATSSRCSFR
jgi:hypothetical protein